MNGQIIDYSFHTGSGTIAGSDGSRYSFTGDQWKTQETHSPGMRVTFDAVGNRAASIYLTTRDPGGARASEKSKGTAVRLAIFLGAFCAHHFYLGHYRTAIVRLGLYPFVLLIGSPVGMKWYPLPFLVFAAIILEILALINAFGYLAKSDEAFYEEDVAD